MWKRTSCLTSEANFILEKLFIATKEAVYTDACGLGGGAFQQAPGQVVINIYPNVVSFYKRQMALEMLYIISLLTRRSVIFFFGNTADWYSCASSSLSLFSF